MLIQKLLDTFFHKILSYGMLLLLIFIPLYPKLPLFDIVHTWVYIRLEDLLVACIIGIYLYTQIKKRTLPETPLTVPILGYWIIGLIVLLFSLFFVRPHLESYFPQLAVLHYLRRIEYMMLFFVAYRDVSNRTLHVRTIIWVLACTLFFIIVYGVGQKFFGFPAFLTMNEEFAKGIPLRLPPTARVSATFGGHYDLAAYLVLTIPILASLIFGVSRFWQKSIFFLLTVGSVILLLFTASRISYGVYIIAITFMLVWQRKKILIIPVIVASILLLNSVSTASERFHKTFRFSDVVVDLSTGKPIGTLDKLEGTSAIIAKSESPGTENLPTGSGYIHVPSNTIPNVDPTPTPKPIRIVELYNTYDLATGSGEIATISGSFLIQKALVYDISITTRFQGQWPKAIEAFKRNILLGSGYSTLSLASDGDYLRMLGETGIVGTIAFLGIFLAAFALFFKHKNELSGQESGLVIGIFAGIVGLFFNAILIDVFEASKVAFILWILLGFALAIITNHRSDYTNYHTVLWKFFTHKTAYMVYVGILAFVVYRSVLGMYFVGDDFTWVKWAQQGSIIQYLTNAEGFFYRPIPKMWYFALYSFFWLKPFAYHFASLMLVSLSGILLYANMLIGGITGIVAWPMSALFIILSIHHENIFWISGQSSMLSAMFMFLSLCLFQWTWKKHRNHHIFIQLLSVLFLFASMLSYDGMIVAPIIVSIVGFVKYKSRASLFLPIVLIPLYWWIRIETHALVPSGDYGYNISKLFVNSIANGSGYILSFFIGPRIIEVWQTLRESFRAYIIPIAGVSVVIIFCIVWVAFRLRRYKKTSTEILMWLSVSIISLLPYLGLGGMAERYTFIFSGFFIIFLGSVISMWFIPSSRVFVKSVCVVLFIGLCIWNIMTIQRLSADWKRASDISQQSVLTMRKEFFPLDSPKSFVIVNMPIHYGRAWIFPTGFPDALWNIFRMNEYTFSVTQARTIEEAFIIPIPEGNREVLVFDSDYKLKRVRKDVKMYFEGE